MHRFFMGFLFFCALKASAAVRAGEGYETAFALTAHCKSLEMPGMGVGAYEINLFFSRNPQTDRLALFTMTFPGPPKLHTRDTVAYLTRLKQEDELTALYTFETSPSKIALSFKAKDLQNVLSGQDRTFPLSAEMERFRNKVAFQCVCLK